MSSYADKKDLTAFLEKPEDWKEWKHDFLLQVESNNLNDHVQKGTPLMPAPEFPDIRRKKYTKTREALQFARSQTIYEQDAEEQREENNETIQEKATGNWMMSDLTNAGRELFNLDMGQYKQFESPYNAQRQSVKKLRDWILKTVSTEYKGTCCEINQSIATWFENLQARCGQSVKTDRKDARKGYRQALASGPKTIKVAQTWITTWENVMAKARKEKVPETMETSTWIDDFFDTVEPIAEQWVTSYRMNKEKAIETGKLGFRDVGNDFRRMLTSKAPMKGRAAKGAFNTSYAGARGEAPEGEGDAQSAEDHPPRRDGDTNPGAKRNKRKSTAKEAHEAECCPACSLIHALPRCYYAFPEKAPAGFKLNQKRLVDKGRIAEADPDLQAKIRGIKTPRSKSKTPKQESSQPSVEDE